MRNLAKISFTILIFISPLFGQAGRVPIYSESSSDKTVEKDGKLSPNEKTKENNDDEVIRIKTDLVIIPAQISQRSGKPVTDLKKEEFKIFENGQAQEIAYFSNEEQPFIVALVLDMSYSSVFKLQEIQNAALTFVNQLRENDKVMVVSFDEKAQVLCEPTSNRKVLKLAIEGAKIASGTSLYSALGLVLNEKFNIIDGRKAIVLLSDGVDTSSPNLTADDILKQIIETDVLVYPIQYNTWDDVQKSRKNSAQIFYDEDDRPYSIEMPRKKGEREEDYKAADGFFKEISNQTGGRVFRVSSNTNLNQAFAAIADELRKVYILGYYPSEERKVGVRYSIKVRFYRPNLFIRARNGYVWQSERNSPK
ncbi:MAG: VWA domain-containing protein [Acidobacteriota bacterium]